LFIAYGFDFIYNLRNSTNAMKLTLFSILIFLIFGVAVSKAQIGEKVPRKGNNKEYYFSILDDNGQQWLLKQGSTTIKVVYKSASGKELRRKGFFMDMSDSILSLDLGFEIKMSDVQWISFKPSVNRSGKALAAYYFFYVGGISYILYSAALYPYEGQGVLLISTALIAPIFALVPLLLYLAFNKYPKIVLQPVGSKFNRIQ
jgi:hypothetical protein